MLDGKDEVESIRLESGQLICVLVKDGSLEICTEEEAQIRHEGEGVLLFQIRDRGSVEIKSPLPGKTADLLILGFRKSSTGDLPAPPGLDFSLPAVEQMKRIPMPRLIRNRVLPELRKPPVSGNALQYWFESRVLEVVSLCFFDQGTVDESCFGSQEQRIEEVRVLRTKKFISENLDQKFDLKTAAEYAGCSPHYLSRTFSHCEGITITQYLRSARIQKAADLLESGRYNVSEAALAVGYQSQSHFTKAFLREKGILPSHYTASP